LKEINNAFTDLTSLIKNTIQQNDQVGFYIRKWIPKLSEGHREILLAAEHLESANELLREASKNFENGIAPLTDQDIHQVAARAAELMPEDNEFAHYHCSEAFTKAVGEHFFGKYDNRIQRMTTGFAGGTGGTHQEMCGALFGGILIIGALYGRAWPYESDEISYQKSAQFREEFKKAFGGTSCQSIKDTGYGSQGIYPCSIFVEKAVRLFLLMLRDK